MQAQEQNLDSLQEKASELYLQGEFRQALAVWRRILELAPKHERAQEGVRLCEVLAEQMEAAEAANIDRPAVPEPAPPLEAPEAPADADAGAGPLDIDLSALDLDGGAGAEPAEQPDPQRQAEGLDLGDAAETETIDLAGPAPDAPAAAASELQQRVTELLAEARLAQQSGDHEQALSLVSRVFILDEENGAARELHESLVSGLAPEEPAEPTPAPAEELPSLDLDEIDAAELPEPEVPAPVETIAAGPLEADDQAQAPAEELPLLGEEPVGDPLSGEDAVIEPVAAEPEPPPAAATARKLALPTKPLAIAAGVMVVAVAAFFGWQQLSGEPSAETAASNEAASGPVAGSEASGPAPAAAAPATPAAPEEDLETVLARGRAAFEGGDYGAAIVAFNEIARRDPGHVEAQEQLIVAGERYRERKAILEQWERAIALFNQGDYRSSLVLLYRLPDDEDPERVARYLRNGWYNMGVQSLQAGDCKAAQENFKEARTVDPSDAGVKRGLALCASCLAGEKGRAFYRASNQLVYRGLDD